MNIIQAMNYSFLSRFSKNRHSNKIWRLLQHLRSHPIFRVARLDIYSPTTEPRQLIVVFGQAHTVWTGARIGNRERDKIVSCQSRLCSYYAYFQQFHGLTQFGGEGLYEGLETSFSDRLCFQLYEQIDNRLGIKKPIALEKLSATARRILDQLGREWHSALRSPADPEKIQLYAAAVSGMTLWNYLSHTGNPGIICRVYPVEGERAYHQVLKTIHHLGGRLQKLEDSYEMRVIRQTGRVENERAAQTLRHYNALAQEFNRIIGSDIRERATLEILKQKAEQEGVVVFTMGIAHRKNYFALLSEYLSDSRIAFVFVTPPELRVNLWMALGLPLVLLIVLIALGYWWQ